MGTVWQRKQPDMDHWFYSASPEEKERRKQEVRRLFHAADKDGDGKLTTQEWREVLLKSGATVTQEQVDKFFETMDRDFDGRLTLEEFMGEETQIEKLFKLMDKNGDGFVTRKEFQTICKKLSKDQVKIAFAQFDSNGDDRLDYREFCSLIREREEKSNA